ncbi:hypothetical protein OL229_14830 [Neisseriaceae bacterium JH1-16]|nr:hypothetical protein [Neisseriaceae bacterium JH1-16]
MSPWHYSPLSFRHDLPAEPGSRLPLNRLLLAERRLVLLSRLPPDSVAAPSRPALAGLLRRVRAWLNGGRG